MSWLFSQALVAAYSADTCSAGAPSAPSNGNPTQRAYLSHGKTMAFSRLSRFGMTCEPLTDTHGEALLTSYRADFHARTSAPPEKAPASTASAAACGSRWPESSVKYCRSTSSWKTHRSLWDEALPWSSVTLPRWGMTVDGLVLQHPTSERPISATVSGLLRIPTPTRTDYKGSRTPESLAACGRDEMNNLRDFCRARIGWKLPSPVGSEILMGWPEGWTDLKPLAMDRFQEWQQQHGGF